MPITLETPIVAPRFATGSAEVDAAAAHALAVGQEVLRTQHAPHSDADLTRTQALTAAVQALIESSGRWPKDHVARSALRAVASEVAHAVPVVSHRATMDALSLRHAVALREAPLERLVATPQMQAAAALLHAFDALRDCLKPL